MTAPAAASHRHIALYPGSFDPMTLGHLDVIGHALRLADKLIIAVGVHHEKRGLFDGAERVALIEESLKDVDTAGVEIEVVTFDGLVVDAMRAHSARIMIRGLRDTTDYNYEMQMAGMNGTMHPDISIVFLPASPAVRHIAASLVRQIASMGGDISGFVPACVAKRFPKRP